MKKSISFIVMFTTIILLPQITWPIVSRNFAYKNISNSEEIQAPILSIETYQNYTEQLEAFINDTMPFKDFLVTCNGIIDYYVFKDSSSDAVVVGKEGWLFYRESIPDYKKSNMYSEAELEKICINLSEMDAYFKRRNIEFVIFIAPNKASIYGKEFLPEYIEANEEAASRVEQVVKYICNNTDIKIVFPKDEMVTAYKKMPDELLFFKKDTHWNNLGGYYGSKILLEEIGVHLPDRGKLELEEVDQPTYMWNKYDLVNMLGLTNVITTDVNYNVTGYLTNNVFFEQEVSTDREAFATYWRTTSTSKDLRKLMFIRDSFGGTMLPYVASSFAEVFSPHSGYVSLSMIEEENPDIVVLEMVERSDICQFSLEAWER